MSEGEMSGGICPGEYVRGGNVRGNMSGGICPGEYVRGENVREYVRGGNVQEEYVPGGNARGEMSYTRNLRYVCDDSRSLNARKQPRYRIGKATVDKTATF